MNHEGHRDIELNMAKKTAAVSPFSTGGGGNRFEALVAVYYLVRLMRQEMPRGMSDALIKEIGLQQRNRDCPIDDIVLYCETTTGLKKRLCLQAKHSITFSENDNFCETVKQAWNQLSDEDFKVDNDGVGLAIGEVCNNSTVKKHVTDLLEWAVTSSTPKTFYEKTQKFVAKTKVLNAFEAGLERACGKKPTKAQVHHLLKHFVVLPFDFTPSTGRDYLDCYNLLLNAVGGKDCRKAKSLHAILYKMATEFAINGGEITRASLAKRISAEAPFAVPVLQQAGEGITVILAKRLQNRIAAEKNSKKYIPEVFVEIGNVKDKARLFCHPVLFLEKLISDVKNIHLYEFNRLLKHSGLKPLGVNINTQDFTLTFDSIEKDTTHLRQALAKFSQTLSTLNRASHSSLARLAPKGKKHVINEISWYINDKARFLDDYEVKTSLEKIDIATAKVFAIVSRAGQGKTNFVCDLAENCLAKRNIPCVFFTGKELVNVGDGQLQSYIARTIYGDDAPGSIDGLMHDVNEEAMRRGTAGIVLIDAINEHPVLETFSREIERLIEKCLEYPHIRIILTCRSEYFDERFGNLCKSSFSDRMVIERQIHQDMAPEHKHRMVNGYLKFFKIGDNRMSEHVFRQLEDDPFLLRVFCEAYGDHTANSLKRIPFISHIRREAVFRMYFNKKFESLKERGSNTIDSSTRRQSAYWSVLKKVIHCMIEQDIYTDVPLSVFDSNQSELQLLLELIDEDILLRKDIDPNKIFAQKEVVNFTFDACRDFLISKYLIEVILQEDESKFRHLVKKLTDPKLTVAEGLQEYLFFASRHENKKVAIETIKMESWYQSILHSYVFELDESAITDEDDKALKEACIQDDPSAPYIVVQLLKRYDVSRHPHANISLLFNVLDMLSDNTFSRLCEFTFGKNNGYYPIETLTKHLKPLLIGNKWHSACTELAKILLYLWDLTGPNYSYPARELFWEFKQRHPNTALRLMKNHIKHQQRGFKRTDFEYGIEYAKV